jgi:hypothetical protein
MQSGIDFITAQIDDALVAHAALLQSMDWHESEADDSRYRDLCDRHLPRMREHQAMLEVLRADMEKTRSGASPDRPASATRHAPRTSNIPRSLADAPLSDYERLASDLNLVRRLEVVFKTFRDAGRTLRIDHLAKVGELAERHHDDYSADAKRLLLQMFVERAQGVADAARTGADRRADFRIS